jgi:hypothetical protein
MPQRRGSVSNAKGKDMNWRSVITKKNVLIYLAIIVIVGVLMAWFFPIVFPRHGGM